MRSLALLRHELKILLHNLLCGLQMLLFRRRAIERLSTSYDQIVLLILFNTITQLAVPYLESEAPRFNPMGFGLLGAEFALTLLLGYLIAKGSGDDSRLPLFVTSIYTLSPFIYLITELALPRLPLDYSPLLQIGLTSWFVAVTFTIIALMLNGRRFVAIALTLLWISLSYPLATELQSSLWYSEGDYALGDEAGHHIDAEQLFYTQPELLDQNIASIEPGVSGSTDLFFVGFSAFGGQDVFMREVDHVQQFSDSRLGTNQRSLLLVNNEATLDTLPLATATNLGITLKQLGERMDRDEDVLLLYLTSHGSRDHTLSVDMWPLPLNSLTPETLRQQLDDAGIRWRIILVSACYSGGFVEPLKDDHTLILTAAAPDKTSFGCASENEYTYFGEALFKDVSEGPYHFIPHFKEAIASIEKREKSEGLEPSQPQLYMGELIRTKLEQLEAGINRYPAEPIHTAAQ